MDTKKEQGDSCNTINSIAENLRTIDQQLTVLHVQIYKAKKQLNECELSGPNIDTVKEEQVYATKKLTFLQEEMMELLNKLQQHRTLFKECDDTKASNEQLRLQHHSLQEKLQEFKKTADCERLEGDITDLKAKCDAAREEREELTKQIQTLKDHLKVEPELQELKEQNDALREELQQLEAKRGNTEELRQQNDALRQEILQINKDVQSEKGLKIMFEALKKTEKALSSQNESMQKELKGLQKKHDGLKVTSDLCHEKLNRIEGLKTENDNVMTQIQEVSTQIQSRKTLQHKCEALEAEEQILLEQSRILKKTYSDSLKKLQKEEDWSSRYDELMEKTNVLKQENDRVTETIREKIGDASVIKAKYESLTAEKQILKSRKNTLQKELQGLEKKQSKEQQLEEKNSVIEEENEALSQETSDLQLKVDNILNTLKGKRLLTIICDSLKTQKDALSRHNAAFYKDLQRLEKKLEKEKALENEYVALQVKIDKLNRQQDALKEEVDLLRDCDAQRSDSRAERTQVHDLVEEELTH